MRINRIVLCGLFAALMCISSIIRIPLFFTPIPITMQLAACLAAGALLGAKDGAITMLVYIFLGAFGLPVFAGMNAGVGYIFGPTGGFIIGFVPCAYLAGKLTRYFYKAQGSHFIKYASIFVSFGLSTFALYFFGASYFSAIMGYSLQKSVALAVLPFVWPDLFKILASTLLVKHLLPVSEFIAPFEAR